MAYPDIIGGALGICISIYIFIETSKFPKDVLMGVGPSYFPRILAITLLIASGGMIMNTILKDSKTAYEIIDIRDKGIQRALLSLLITIVYCISLRFIGFIISSLIYLFIMMYLLKNRKYVRMIVVSCGVTLGVYFVFKGILNITLPTGFLGL